MLSAVGVSVEYFYCCGRLSKTTFSIGEARGSNAKTSHRADNCCKTTKASFKVKDQHVGANALHLNAEPFAVAIVAQHLTALPAPEVVSRSVNAFYAHGPPERQQLPIYLLNCTYRI